MRQILFFSICLFSLGAHALVVLDDAGATGYPNYNVTSAPGFDIRSPYMNEQPDYVGNRLCGPNNTQVLNDAYIEEQIRYDQHQRDLQRDSNQIRRNF